MKETKQARNKWFNPATVWALGITLIMCFLIVLKLVFNIEIHMGFGG